MARKVPKLAIPQGQDREALLTGLIARTVSPGEVWAVTINGRLLRSGSGRTLFSTKGAAANALSYAIERQLRWGALRLSALAITAKVAASTCWRMRAALVIMRALIDDGTVEIKRYSEAEHA